MQNPTRIHIILAWCLFSLLGLVACDRPSVENSMCDISSRDQCRKTVGCFLDYGGQPDSYVCRLAKNDCERLTNNGGQLACEGASSCTWAPGACYCPEGMLCFCGGGPPSMCRER